MSQANPKLLFATRETFDYRNRKRTSHRGIGDFVDAAALTFAWLVGADPANDSGTLIAEIADCLVTRSRRPVSRLTSTQTT